MKVGSIIKINFIKIKINTDKLMSLWLIDNMDIDDENGILELTEKQLDDWLNESVLPNYAEDVYNHKCIKPMRDLRKQSFAHEYTEIPFAHDMKERDKSYI